MSDAASESSSPETGAPLDGEDAHEPLHAVLLETARPVDAAAIGRALAALLGTAAHDGARRARDAGGILFEDVSRAEAEAIAGALVAAGIGARAVAAEAVPALGAVEEAVAARLAYGGLEVLVRAPTAMGGARRRLVPYRDVRLAIACALDAGESPRKEDLSRKKRGVGAEPEVRALDRDPETLLVGEDAGLEPEAVRLLSGVLKRRKDERRETSLLLDLVLAGGGVVRLRREGLRAMDPEAGRGHSMARFTAIAKEATAAVGALGGVSPPEGQVLLWNGLLAPALFGVEDELARYERWSLARERSPDAGASALPPTPEIA